MGGLSGFERELAIAGVCNERLVDAGCGLDSEGATRLVVPPAAAPEEAVSAAAGSTTIGGELGATIDTDSGRCVAVAETAAAAAELGERERLLGERNKRV